MLGIREGQVGDWKLGSEDVDVERVPFADEEIRQRPALKPGFLKRAKLYFGMDDLVQVRPAVGELGRPAPFVEVS
jgi:hypothetical protein